MSLKPFDAKKKRWDICFVCHYPVAGSSMIKKLHTCRQCAQAFIRCIRCKTSTLKIHTSADLVTHRYQCTTCNSGCIKMVTNKNGGAVISRRFCCNNKCRSIKAFKKGKVKNNVIYK